MSHYKCVPCRVRVVTGAARDQAGELCPQCGAMLDPVDDLREIVGYPVMRQGSARPQGEGLALHEALAGRLGDAIAHRLLSAAASAADHDWGIGDEERPCAAAVALAPPSDSWKARSPSS
jgi:hypothetical protein